MGTPTRHGTPPPTNYGSGVGINVPNSGSRAPSIQYGSFDSRLPIEDAEVVRRHLVTEDLFTNPAGNPSSTNPGGALDDEFSSLQLQGGDITRPIYRYVEGIEAHGGRRSRSRSFHVPRPEPEDDTLDINSIKQIGGFRRNYIRRTEGVSPTGSGHGVQPRRPFLTRNFIEFLTLHGHFAGEDLEDDESDEATMAEGEEGEEDEEAGEGSALLQRPRTPGRKRSKSISQGTAGTGKAVLLLLKSFVGTGVLFLPKA